tara:strand:- start:5343 stop:5714 length:372 start_codon:yes stop_codon:yes gene_type:complete
MPIQNATLNFRTVNVSAQVGDIVYKTRTGIMGGFNLGGLDLTKMLGPILDITLMLDGTTNILIQYNSDIVSLPTQDHFISFAKDKRVNTTSLLGYYASVNFVNNSSTKIELFSIGSEVSESSK